MSLRLQPQRFATVEAARYYPELAPLMGWSWCWSDGPDILAGHHRHAGGHDTLRLAATGTAAYLVRRDITLTTVLACTAPLADLVALLLVRASPC